MINQQALGVASYGTLMDWDLRPFFPAPLAFSFPLFLPLALPLPWGCDAASRLSEKNLPHQSCLSEKNETQAGLYIYIWYIYIYIYIYIWYIYIQYIYNYIYTVRVSLTPKWITNRAQGVSHSLRNGRSKGAFAALRVFLCQLINWADTATPLKCL